MRVSSLQGSAVSTAQPRLLCLAWGFVGSTDANRAVVAYATAANICTDEYQAETGGVPTSRDATLELLGPSSHVVLGVHG